mgnify:FL=1
MNYYFTWHDINCIFEKNRYSWPEIWTDVKVYSDCIEIYQNSDQSHEASVQYLKELFGQNYSVKRNALLIDFTGLYLDIIFQCDDIPKAKKKYEPLFKEINHEKCAKEAKESNDFDGLKMIAFYSYKSGVGQTSSLIAFLRQYTKKYPDKKILVIDANVQAPGLTLMAEAECREISYLDILSIMNYEQITDRTMKKLASLIKDSTVSVTTDKQKVNQYFIPVYQEKEQIMNITVVSDLILLTKENKFFITETIAEIAKKAEADVVLIDLQDGITEYSAPFLFDPRVIKYYVTSTSYQSVKGINQVLKQVYKNKDVDIFKSRILLTMIPEAMSHEEIQEIENQIVEGIESVADIDNATLLQNKCFIELKFDEAFIRVPNFDMLCEKLKDSELAPLMQEQLRG